MALRSTFLALAFALVACGSNDTKLKVTGLDPDNGDVEGGTYVRIHGNAFVNPVRSAKVYFGSRQGTVDRFASDSELIVQAPGGKPNETVDVLVIFEPGGEIKIPKAFTFKEKNVHEPSVDDLAPADKPKK
jgi:IPT/TIG domain-containing protein